MNVCRIATVLLALVAPAACSDAGGGASGSTVAGASTSDDVTPTSGSTSLGTDQPPPVTTAGGNGGGGGDEGIDSVQWGPDDPPIPGEYSAFAAEGAGGLSCTSIDDRAQGDEFWTLAAQVCRVFSGEGDWPDVASVPEPPLQGNLYEGCLDRELAEVLERALAWHAAHPGQSPVVRFPATGTHSPCQTRLYDVAVVDGHPATDQTCQNGESVPASSVAVTISAPGITGYANPQATVDGQLLCVIDDSEDNALRTFVVLVPTAGEERTVRIDVDSNYGTLSADLQVPAGSGEPDGTPTETTAGGTSGESTDTTSSSDGALGTTAGP